MGDQSHVSNFERRLQHWLPRLVLLALAGLLLFQALAYYFRFPLSLGPRVILQPWLLQGGFLQYENIADQHTPLMPILLSVLTPLFSDGLRLAKIVLVALISLSTVLTFLAARRTIGWLGGLGAASFFVIWSPGFSFAKLWHETFLAPLYLLLLLFYDSSASYHSRKSLLFLGLLGGIAILVKQHAAIVFATFVIWNAFTNWHAHRSFSVILRDTALISLAATLPIMAFALHHYVQAGTLANFLYWTISFNLVSGYASLAAQPPDIAQVRTIASACLLLPAATFCLIELKRKGDKRWLNLGWGLILLAASSLTAYPRFAFFHLQAALPVLAWLSSLTLAFALRPGNSNSALQSSPSFATGIAIALSAFWIITAGSAYQSVFRADQPRKVWEYTDLVPLADEIRQRIGPTDCIYIFPDDEATANLYYLLRCLPPKFWGFSYPWYMSDSVKSRIVLTLQEHPPEWVVYFPGRWDIENRAPEVIAYIQDNYQRDAKLHWVQGEVWLLKRVP